MSENIALELENKLTREISSGKEALPVYLSVLEELGKNDKTY